MRVSLYPTAASAALHQPVAIVIPIYNEAENIRAVVAEWTNALDGLKIGYQFLLINDGSKDQTADVLEEMEAADPDKIVVISKPNSGHGRSCRLGYDAAVASPAVQWVLQIDSDGQCAPSYFPEFWSKTTSADCVFGCRVQRDDGVARMMTSKICKLGATVLGGRNMVDPNVPYRLIRKEILGSALQRIPASFNIHNVAVTYILKKTNGLRWEYVPIRFRDRQGGSNSINLLNVAQWGVDMLLELRRLK